MQSCNPSFFKKEEYNPEWEKCIKAVDIETAANKDEQYTGVIGGNATVQIAQCDITNEVTDAITNAANEQLWLGAGVAGAIVSVADYAETFQTNNLTISPNGSEKIGGSANDSTLSTEGESVTLLYVDSNEGWKNVSGTTETVIGQAQFPTATGGTSTT